MKRKKLLIVIVATVLLLIVLIIFGPAIKSSILVGTLVPYRMTYADVAKHMGSEGLPVPLSDAAYYGWYLPNGKFLVCRFHDTKDSVQNSVFPDDRHLTRVRVYDEPKESWIRGWEVTS
jgi:hypothetical protein